MSKRKPGRLIPKSEIKEELRPISISNVDYITPSGNVYCNYEDDLFFLKKNTPNANNGYLYTSIRCSDGKQRGCRTHRLVAEAYLENPNNLPLVMHLDNNKNNINVENLKWGTASENTKAAYDDGLAVNAKGLFDSQSFQIAVFDINKNYLGWYGSVKITSSIYGVSDSTILRQCRHEIHGTPRYNYYFRFLEEYLQDGFVL